MITLTGIQVEANNQGKGVVVRKKATSLLAAFVMALLGLS